MPCAKQAPPQVSVVVPFFDSEDTIERCIESLLQQQGVRGAWELILVDNGSTDGARAIVERYREVALLREERPGAYSARNTGIRAARAPLVAFTDADCQVDRDWLRTLQEAMDDPAIAIVVGHCRYPASASPALRFLGRYENAKTAYVLRHCAPEFRYAYANNMAVRAAVFGKIGLFQEWGRAADSELVHRLAARCPALLVCYRHAMRVEHLEFERARARLRRLRLYTKTNSRIPTFRELGPAQRLRVLLAALTDNRRFGSR